MAGLIGKLTPMTKDGIERKTVSRLSGGSISSTLETWNGAVRVQLHADGSFRVTYGQKGSAHTTLIAHGNVDDGKREARCGEDGSRIA